MKPISLTPQEVGSLNIRANQRGVLNKRTIVSGQGNLIGFAGEAMFAKAFPSATKVDSRDYDFVVAGKTIDVKTRGSDKTPRMDWDCKVPTSRSSPRRSSRAAQHARALVACFVRRQPTGDPMIVLEAMAEHLEQPTS